MAGDWQELPFSEAVMVNPDVPLTRGEAYPFIDMSAVSTSSRCVLAGEIRAFSGGGSRFVHGDTLMARITPCLENGKIGRFCGKEGEAAHGSTEFIVIRGREGVSDTNFAYYLTKWEGVSGYAISQMTGTSGRQRVPTDALDHLVVSLPPLSEQHAIAHILGTLDDKIELNRRMSETLEALARALFESWFVDFDPVRRNIARRRGQPSPRPVGHPSPNGRGNGGEGVIESTAFDHLFPDRLVDSELGEIPEGWKVQSFSQTIEIIGGGTPKTSMPEYWDGDIPWFSVADAPADGEVWVLDTEKKISKSGLESSSAQLLPVGTTIVSARGTVGRIALVGTPMAMNQSCYGLRSKLASQGFFNYFLVRALVAQLKQRTHGSVFDTITRDTLAGVDVGGPPASLAEAFEARVAPLLERIRASLIESRTLAALRDTLLPKLISGELRVQSGGELSGVRP